MMGNFLQLKLQVVPKRSIHKVSIPYYNVYTCGYPVFAHALVHKFQLRTLIVITPSPGFQYHIKRIIFKTRLYVKMIGQLYL
jgi:hypothetical protein